MRKKKHPSILPNNRILLSYIYQYRGHYLLGILSLIIVDLFQLQIPVITKAITDGLNTRTYHFDDVVRQGIYLIIIGVIITIGRYGWRYFIFGTGRKIEFQLRNKFFEQIEKLSLRYYNEHKTGELMALATNDINAIRMMVGQGVLMACDAILMTGLVIFKMIQLVDVQMTIYAIAPMPIIALGSIGISKLINRSFRKKQEAFSKITDQVQENISGIRVIKAFVQEHKELEAFNQVNQLNYDRNMKLVKIFALVNPLLAVVAGLSTTLILGFGGYRAMLGTITLGDFMAFIAYIGMLVWPMQAIGMCINVMSQGFASLQRIQAVLNEQPDIVDGDDLIHLDDIKGAIEIKNLTFKYPNTKAPALRNISLNVKQGQTIGIVGRTGSGKTTLMNLLLRLYNPPEGSIFFDGIDITRFPVLTLRNYISYVPQDNFLFSNTIAKNIAFGRPDATLEEVVLAATIANVHDNIIEFPHQYETIVGERGVTLSGGQKQRVSIARALLTEGSILILDDSVSAVDTDTEEKIMGHLHNARKNKTTIIIAHRISTIQNADSIIVMDEGRIAERGSHEQLLKKKGLYYEMVQRQILEEALETAE